MLYRGAANETISVAPRRRGRIGCLIVAVLLLTLLFGVLVIDSFFVTGARVQQETATDAPALAGGETLASEALLYADPNDFLLNGTSLLSITAQNAINIGPKNFVAGKPLAIVPADISFNIIDIPSRTIIGSMSADPRKVSSLSLQQMRSINAVQILGQSTNARGNALRLPMFNRDGYQMITRTHAVLDGFVYGFSPYVQGFDPTANPPLRNAFAAADQTIEGINIPLAPLAIFSDPTGINPQSWEFQVESGVDFSSPAALDYGTMTLTLGNLNLDAGQRYDPAIVNATFLAIGTNYISNPPSLYATDGANQTIDNQIRNGTGIAPADYLKYYEGNGNLPFALDPTVDPPGPLFCPGTPVGPAPGTPDGQTLAESLWSLQSIPMIWPLFAGYDSSNPPRVVISGFVVARVSGVQVVEIDGQLVVQVELTPSLRATRTALTYVSRWPTTQPAPSAFFSFRFPNAYVKRIRLMWDK
jgi:hypothetical protein